MFYVSMSVGASPISYGEVMVAVKDIGLVKQRGGEGSGLSHDWGVIMEARDAAREPSERIVA